MRCISQNCFGQFVKQPFSDCPLPTYLHSWRDTSNVFVRARWKPTTQLQYNSAGHTTTPQALYFPRFKRRRFICQLFPCLNPYDRTHTLRSDVIILLGTRIRIHMKLCTNDQVHYREHLPAFRNNRDTSVNHLKRLIVWSWLKADASWTEKPLWKNETIFNQYKKNCLKTYWFWGYFKPMALSVSNTLILFFKRSDNVHIMCTPRHVYFNRGRLDRWIVFLFRAIWKRNVPEQITDYIFQ